jgi:RimJ/RimL family protein N-acetyltransferase
MILKDSEPKDLITEPHWRPSQKTILNQRNGEIYIISRSEEVIVANHQLETLTSLCNEPAVYKIFFKDKLNGEPFSIQNAAELLETAAQGWKDQSQFFFTILDRTGLISGIIRIKSANRDLAEIGYWCSEKHRGIMSNAVRVVSELAEEAGFSALCAKVRKDNWASIKVLNNNNFLCSGDWPGDPSRFRFEVQLSPLNLANCHFLST